MIHRLSQTDLEQRLPMSFMQELQEDFGPHGLHRLNSTVIDEEPETCAMEEDEQDGDDEEELPTQISTKSQTNQKCLLDELLQTEEVNDLLMSFRFDRSIPDPCSLNMKLSLSTNNYERYVWN